MKEQVTDTIARVDNTEVVLDNTEITFDNVLENIEDTVEKSAVMKDDVVQEETVVEEGSVTQEKVVEEIEKEIIDEREEVNKEEEFMVSSIEAAQVGDCLEEDELALDDTDELVNDCNTTPSMSEKEGWCDHPSARSIMDRFPHMYPFDDGEITECVRIEPKDLGSLPMDAWVLGNNSFLLHSFSTYRHLLFAKKMSREGIYYMIMVPGAYNVREKHMAGMFGFKDFKCSRRRKLRDGDFGYWYAYIDYSNTSTI